MDKPLTERRRSPWPARFVGVSVAAMATMLAATAVFGVAPLWGGDVAQRMEKLTEMGARAAREWVASLPPQPPVPA
jgi:hypothetical protein